MPEEDVADTSGETKDMPGEPEAAEAKELWPSRSGFILAAMGSAIGLGNVWRFPYLVGRYGGGTFLVPFIIALITTGIPLLNLEMGLGRIMRSSPPFAFGKIDKRLRVLGWSMLLVGFVVIIYYTVIVGWSLAYIPKALTLSWQNNPDGALSYFMNDFVKVSSGPGVIGGISPGVFFAMAATWITMYLILFRGLGQLNKVVKVAVPLPAFLLVIMAIRSLTLPGAMDGLNYYLTPNWSELWSAEIWLAAYAQVFFTLSLAGGVMIAYASRLPKGADVNSNARIVAFGDVGFAFFAGIVVFSTLGFMSHTTGQPLPELAASGAGLAFGVYPTAIAQMPTGAVLMGLLFFTTLFIIGLDSAFALLEAMNLGFKDAKVNFKHILPAITIFGFLMSIFFATGGGYHWIEIVDAFFNEVLFVSIGILQCLVIAYVYGSKKFMDQCNEGSEVKLGKWWEYSIKYFTPGFLIIALTVHLGGMVWGLATGGYAYGNELFTAKYMLMGAFIPAGIILCIAYYFYRRWDPRD